MTNGKGSRDGKSFRGIWQLRTGIEINERIWMVGDIVSFSSIFLALVNICGWWGRGGAALHRGTAASSN